MKITAVNNQSHTSYHNNFKGLWGQDVMHSATDENFNGKEITNRYYYPFMDETADEIKLVKDSFSKQSINYNGEQSQAEFKEICNVMNRLLFTKEEWSKYITNKKLKNTTRNFIEENLRRLNLKQYLVK